MSNGPASALLALILPAAFVFAENTEPQGNPEATIRYLLDYVARSDCTFVRNGMAYDGKQAASHMESKYRSFRKEIKMPEDFIRLAATKSLQTGKPYTVTTQDGKELPCEEWMKRVLEEDRKAQTDRQDKQQREADM
jgi:hypothetical protein